MSATLPNLWHHRRVAEANAKACWICYKPSSSVLITPDNKDFFYVCPGHLKDRGFCQPDADEAEALAAKQKKEELDREIEKVKQEYEEKQRRKKEKRKEKEKGKEKDKEKEKETKKDEEDEDKKDEKERDEKIKALSKSEPKADEGPRVFVLSKHVEMPNFYQMRIKRIRDAEAAKRNRERLSNPNTFPSVPTGDP